MVAACSSATGRSLSALPPTHPNAQIRAFRGDGGRVRGVYSSTGVIVNVGAGQTDYGANVINLDIAPGPGVAVVGVAEELPFADGSCQGVILMAVLEHVRDADRTLSEARRVLRPNGRLIIDVPFIQGFHPGPGDYRRFTEQGLRQEVQRHGFRVEQSGVAVGPASAMAWITSEFLALLLSGRSSTGYRLAKIVTRWLAAPIKYGDVLLERHPMAYNIASAIWVVAGVAPEAGD